MPSVNRRIPLGPLGLIILLGASTLGFVVSWGLFESYQQEHAKERESVSNNDESVAARQIDICQRSMRDDGLAQGLICLANVVGAEAETKKSEYDLKAQQEMAEWAFGLLLVSIFGLIFTALGVILVWLTFRATRDTVTAMQREQRPWVVISVGESALYFRDEEKTGVQLTTSIAVKNISKSIASDVTFRSTIVRLAYTKGSKGFSHRLVQKELKPVIAELLKSSKVSAELDGGETLVPTGTINVKRHSASGSYKTSVTNPNDTEDESFWVGIFAVVYRSISGDGYDVRSYKVDATRMNLRELKFVRQTG